MEKKASTDMTEKLQPSWKSWKQVRKKLQATMKKSFKLEPAMAMTARLRLVDGEVAGCNGEAATKRQRRVRPQSNAMLQRMATRAAKHPRDAASTAAAWLPARRWRGERGAASFAGG